MAQPVHVTIWNEFRHEKQSQAVKTLYPDGIHQTLAQFLAKQSPVELKITTATLDEPDHGLTDEVIDQTDVFLWWGHCAHEEVKEEIVNKVHARVLQGAGMIVLHSGHYSKIFKKLMGTGCGLKWREQAEVERLWSVNPGHPILDGIDEYFELPQTEMYGELFDIPTPDELVLISWFEGGEVFRSGCCWTRGKGKVFYFRPGHETFPIYHDKNVQKIITNSVSYVAPRTGSPYTLDAPNITKPLSPIVNKGHVVDASLH